MDWEGYADRAPSVVEFARDLGDPVPPLQIEQEMFDLDLRALRRFLAEGELGKSSRDGLLYNYAVDLGTVDPIQPSLLAYMLPFCVEAWQRRLNSKGDEEFVGRFHDALYMRPGIIAQVLGPAAEDLVTRYLFGSLYCAANLSESLSSIRVGWVPFFVSLSTLWDDHALSWWSTFAESRHGGHCRSYLGYMASIAYAPSDNPLRYVDPVDLWEDMAYASDFEWKSAMKEGFEGALQLDHVSRCLEKCIGQLESAEDKDMAALVCDDIITNRRDYFERRVENLIDNLAGEDPVLEWWDEYGVVR